MTTSDAREADVGQWFRAVVADAPIATAGPVRGTEALTPLGASMWRRVRDEIEVRLDRIGAGPALFPSLAQVTSLGLPDDARTDAHAIATVTHVGGRALPEPLLLRSVGDDAVQPFLRDWVDSVRSLPLLVHQWIQGVRWEPRPVPLIRPVSFAAHEGFGVHVDEESASSTLRSVVYEVFSDVLHNVLAIPVDVVRVVDDRRARGARATVGCVAEVGGGTVLNVAMAHDLGQRMSAVHDVVVTGPDGMRSHAWQTTWNLTTRVLGAVALVHGDDDGLVLPPRLAPIQVEVVGTSADVVDKLLGSLASLGVRARRSDGVGWRGRGTPILVDVVDDGLVEVTDRVSGASTRQSVDATIDGIDLHLTRMQAELLQAATAGRDARRIDAVRMADLAEATEGAVVRMPWAAVDRDQLGPLERVGVEARGLVRPGGGLPESQNEPDLLALFARPW